MAFEERVYEGGKFATVELTGKPFDEALREAVLKLLKYVGGSNDQGERFDRLSCFCVYLLQLNSVFTMCVCGGGTHPLSPIIGLWHFFSLKPG